MFEQFRRMWGHYIGLTLIIVILSKPIAWIYQTVNRRLGPDIALLALTVTIIVVMVFAVRGAVHTSRIEGFLREQVTVLQHPPKPGTTVKPFEFKVEEPATNEEEYEFLPETPNRTRTKQKNFPEERIRKAVLTWERRDKNFHAHNLEEFLEMEFGNMDGVPSMATSTFYDHRKRILEEIKAKQTSVQE